MGEEHAERGAAEPKERHEESGVARAAAGTAAAVKAHVHPQAGGDILGLPRIGPPAV